MAPVTNHTPFFLQPQSGDPDLTFTGNELRQYNRAMIAVADGFQGEQGVLGGTFAVAQRAAGANFSVDVAAGKAYITDDDITNGGTAVCWSDATVNVTVPSPGASTENHRLVLQLRNKLENGTYTTYDFTPLLLADTGSGTPAEPNSAITLALIQVATGQSSVTNANITDYRQIVGPVTAYKASGTSRSSGTMTADPDLQLNNLAANAIYAIDGYINYTGGTGTSEGDIKWSWNATGATMVYNAIIAGTGGGNISGVDSNTDSSTVQAGTEGSSTPVGAWIRGTIDTGNAPCSMVFKWALVTTGGGITNTVVNTGSYLSARRLS